MTTSILLIRHAAHADLGQRLSGRGPAPGLTAHGRDQAESVATHLADTALGAVHASPRQRAQETAQAIATRHGLSVTTAGALDEVDFGEWTGRRYDALEIEPAWTQWNTSRASARPPGGETMVAAQERASAHVREVACAHEGGTVAMVSHCDIIRSVIAGALGLPLDNLLRFDVDPASVSRLSVGGWGMQVASINERAAA
ncbi:MAG: histidine phosphatase family protein [Sphingomicrobium sp.]|nr:histidine phosphatase family protein [Sphingomonadales bacterium]